MFVKCINNNGIPLTFGYIYIVLEEYPEHYLINDDNGDVKTYAKTCFREYAGYIPSGMWKHNEEPFA